MYQSPLVLFQVEHAKKESDKNQIDIVKNYVRTTTFSSSWISYIVVAFIQLSIFNMIMFG